ncbi:alpha/beta hydrolase [Phycicoccus sp. Root101]|uniref:alpha/beta hydrolase n=1 Tax=Phycicoccus sp. Root101 TaxID=1736421 RepID=UPI000A61CA57|nr:alpha/beta hydrolase [Phycicoccus sp. Root101]
MGLRADLTAWTMGRSASRTVTYGDALQFEGGDLAAPTEVRVPTRHGAVRCELYRPRGEPTGVLVHLHGGAFVMRYPAMDDFWARYMAARAGVVVLNVDYDVAPRHRYPVGHEEAYDVLAWAAWSAQTLLPRGTPVAVSGLSAGGNLAAAACLLARDDGSVRPALQVLGVPSLDVAEPVATKVARAPRAMIGTELLDLVRATYFRDASRRGEAYASPLRADRFDGLAPALVMTAQHDVLRHEGDAYAVRLADAGVPVEHLVVEGADHYFLDRDPRRARAILERVAVHLRASLADS